MISVVPAIIPNSFSDLENKIGQVKGLVKLVQVDVVDGVFAPKTSWPYRGEADLDFAKLVSGEEGLPFWEEVEVELDMMVTKPEEKLDDWLKAGISGAIIHLESTEKLMEIIERLREAEIRVGVALKPSTPNEQLLPFVEKVDFIQVMGNDNIGSQGVGLQDGVYEKIADLHARYPEKVIAVDIGVNPETAPKLVVAGVSKLVSGSAIYESDDKRGIIEQLKQM